MLSYDWLLKKHRDRGDAVLVTVLICIPLFLVAFMFAVGMAQNGWFKASFSDSAQAAAQKAAGTINNAGYLGEASLDEFVTEYMQLTNRTVNANLVTGRDSAAYQTSEGAGSTCSTVEVSGVKHASPYIELRLDRNRNTGVSEVGSPLYVSEGGAAPKAVFTLNTRVNYRVLSATVYEASHSLLGDGFTMLGKEAGCFTSKSVVSGITFGSNEDLGLTGGDASCWTPEDPTPVKDTKLQTNGSIKLYDGPDYTCPVVGYATSPYLEAVAEYGGFYKVTYGGESYWVDNQKTRTAAACTDRDLSSNLTAISPVGVYQVAGTTQKTYSAPFPDCEIGTAGGKLNMKASYSGEYGDYVQIADGANAGKWMNKDDVNAQRVITFDANAGVGGGKITAYEKDKVPAYATPTRSGFRFVGWFTERTGGKQISFPAEVTSDVTYYAQWTNAVYVVSWNGGGGTLSGCTPTSYGANSGVVNLTASNCQTVSRTGYTFDGFTPSSIGSGQGDVIVTAKWKPTTYSVSYNFNGGTTIANCGPTSYTVESATFSPTCKPTRSGYNFINWSPSSVTKGSTGNKTFVAQWAKVQYTLTLSNKGGTPTSYTRTADAGSTIVLPTPKREFESSSNVNIRYVFNGWTTSSTPPTKEVDYSNSYTVKKNETLYAHYVLKAGPLIIGYY